MRRRLRLAALLALTVTACGGGDPSTVSSPTPTPAAGSPTAATPSPDPTAASPSPTAEATVVTIEVSGGEVQGGIARPEVALGETVRFEVTSDTADHVHVHGYDLFEDVPAGGTATLEFTADIPGQFEVELEDSHLKIAELVVRG